jgi:hypothetical protein
MFWIYSIARIQFGLQNKAFTMHFKTLQGNSLRYVRICIISNKLSSSSSWLLIGTWITTVKTTYTITLSILWKIFIFFSSVAPNALYDQEEWNYEWWTASSLSLNKIDKNIVTPENVTSRNIILLVLRHKHVLFFERYDINNFIKIGNSGWVATPGYLCFQFAGTDRKLLYAVPALALQLMQEANLQFDQQRVTHYRLSHGVPSTILEYQFFVTSGNENYAK